MHKDVKVRPFWYSDVFVFPKLVTIVTTLDIEGRVNAAPYSHIMQYDVMQKTPRIYLGFRNTSHTFQNIRDTGDAATQFGKRRGVGQVYSASSATAPSDQVRPAISGGQV